MNYLYGFDHIEKGMLLRSKSNTKIIGILSCNNHTFESACDKLRSIIKINQLDVNLKFIKLDSEKLFDGTYVGVWLDFYFSINGYVSMENKKRLKDKCVVNLFDFDLKRLKDHFIEVAEYMTKKDCAGFLINIHLSFAKLCECMAPSFINYMDSYIPIPKIILNQLKNN